MDVEYNLRHVNYSKVVIIVHGLFSNKDRSRFISLEKELLDGDFSIFRFTFSYVNSLKKRGSSIQSQVDDMRGVINFLKRKGYKKIGVVGESFGGAISLMSFQKDICTYVLWAPITSSRVNKMTYVKILFKRLISINQAFFQWNVYCRVAFLREAISIRSTYILKSITVPVLIIHGAMDNIVPIKNSYSAAKTLPRASVVVIDNAGHVFDDRSLGQVFGYTKQWLISYM